MSSESASGGTSSVVKGLKGIKAAESSICLVNGTEGRLLYRGYSIDDLATHATFEETAYLLLNEDLPSQFQLQEFREALRSQLTLPDQVTSFLQDSAASAPPMSVLRTAVSLCGLCDADADNEDLSAIKGKAISLIAVLPTIVASISRIRQGEQPVAPDPELSHAGNFIAMLNGRQPTADEERAMDLILTLHAEHGFNASTFAGRVICATMTDIYSAITGAIGALKGKLHGGANTEVLKTLRKLGSVDQVENWVQTTRANKGKFMGFGHAVYQTADPRAKFLKDYGERLSKEHPDGQYYLISEELERQIVPLINKNCNVDFYSASLQHFLGLSHELFTCVFAASRVVGWSAHILEQLSNNKIIRPSAEYVGPTDRTFVALSDRT